MDELLYLSTSARLQESQHCSPPLSCWLWVAEPLHAAIEETDEHRDELGLVFRLHNVQVRDRAEGQELLGEGCIVKQPLKVFPSREREGRVLVSRTAHNTGQCVTQVALTYVGHLYAAMCISLGGI